MNDNFLARLEDHVRNIYPDSDAGALCNQIVEAFWPDGLPHRKTPRTPSDNLWSEKDAIVITYGNSIQDGAHKPLDLLQDFLRRDLKGVINSVHILSFFPFTSDDGFAVTDYRAVNPALGEWADIQRIGTDFNLMSDLVLNHVSSQSKWFNDYRQGHEPYNRFFFEASPEDDLSQVVRPRTYPLLRKVDTADGERYVWCTFSHDQVDLDFRNPEVLLEFLRILRLHVDNQVRVIRLDAVAFLWKEVGTSCIHLPQTHEIVRLMRLLCDFAHEPIILLTETNVPSQENLSYFGNRNEAHTVYNFPLPPLLVHAMMSGSAQYLNSWQAKTPPPQMGCAYLNFSASHDGIGIRPAEGILPPDEIENVIDTARRNGGLVSTRTTPDGGEAPYELNITFFDALRGTFQGEDAFHIERYLASQTVVMALEGIPAFYIHTLLATGNDLESVEKTGLKRAINRHRWNYPDLRARLADASSPTRIVLDEIKRRLSIRGRQPAFHPNATQFTLQLEDRIFGLWRQSLDRDQSIFALHNVSAQTIEIDPVSINLIDSDDWHDLLDGEPVASVSEPITLAPYQCRWISNR